MKIIKVSKCSECLAFNNDQGGTKPNCKHPKTFAKRPYAVDRVVDPDRIADEFCPLEDANE